MSKYQIGLKYHFTISEIPRRLDTCHYASDLHTVIGQNFRSRTITSELSDISSTYMAYCYNLALSTSSSNVKVTGQSSATR